MKSSLYMNVSYLSWGKTNSRKYPVAKMDRGDSPLSSGANIKLIVIASAVLVENESFRSYETIFFSETEKGGKYKLVDLQ